MENDIGRSVVDAALAIHKALGPGLLESAYEACLAHELTGRGHDVDAQRLLPVHYKGLRIDKGSRLDLLIDSKVVLEFISVDQVTDSHRAQILSYLRLGGFKLGFLINFNTPRIRDGIQRFVNGLNER